MKILNYILNYIRMDTPAGTPKKTGYQIHEREIRKLLNNMKREEPDSALVKSIITPEDVKAWQEGLKDYRFD